MLWRNSSSVAGQTHKKLTSVCSIYLSPQSLPPNKTNPPFCMGVQFTCYSVRAFNNSLDHRSNAVFQISLRRGEVWSLMGLYWVRCGTVTVYHKNESMLSKRKTMTQSLTCLFRRLYCKSLQQLKKWNTLPHQGWIKQLKKFSHFHLPTERKTKIKNKDKVKILKRDISLCGTVRMELNFQQSFAILLRADSTAWL